MGQAGRLAPPEASQAAGRVEYRETQLVSPLTALSWHCRAAGRPSWSTAAASCSPLLAAPGPGPMG
eukprot:14731810-Alexandrium_andersonii.AAC.1